MVFNYAPIKNFRMNYNCMGRMHSVNAEYAERNNRPLVTEAAHEKRRNWFVPLKSRWRRTG